MSPAARMREDAARVAEWHADQLLSPTGKATTRSSLAQTIANKIRAISDPDPDDPSPEWNAANEIAEWLFVALENHDVNSGRVIGNPHHWSVKGRVALEKFRALASTRQGSVEATSRYGLKAGELQWQWRQGLRSDRNELEWAIVDALAMGGIEAWPGDGVSCAAQIVTAQMDRAEKAERETPKVELGWSTEATLAFAKQREATIVKWLRKRTPTDAWNHGKAQIDYFADCIERGDHLAPVK